ncbi:MAG TPA: thermonuclease family protein [Planctomycetota bacterium]|nr:thermonuclease family protein [Planctomycetota bacterium]
MRSLLPMLLLLSAAGVETTPVSVLRVIDGDSFEVAGDLGGLQIACRVRLAFVDCPETVVAGGAAMPEAQDARDALMVLLPIGTLVTLAASGERFERDAADRVVALVTVRDGGDASTTVNARMILAGWSPYWRKDGDAQPDLHAKLQSAEGEAEKAKAGCWANARQWMLDSAKARTAPTASERAPQAPTP